MANRHPGEVGVDWFEAGVTSGFIKNVGCTSKLTTYYGFNSAAPEGSLY